jgi:hypothetical protein
MRHTRERLSQASAVIFASPIHLPPTPEERSLLLTLKNGELPFLVVLTHADLPQYPLKTDFFKGIKTVEMDCRTMHGGGEVRIALASLSKKAKIEATPLEGLSKSGDHLLLVMPQDRAAPRGRLLLPQAETVRDAIDRRILVTSVTTEDVPNALASFRKPPDLVITDSQVFGRVAAFLPLEQPLTSFSIVFARKKGELPDMVSGLSALDSFSDGGRVFVFESCSHHTAQRTISLLLKYPVFSGKKPGKMRFSQQSEHFLKIFARMILSYTVQLV